tara:strand:+ start:2742 stop:5000 length:2259 start_codon:yes stop_codon:yes gene_type:complete
LEKFYGKPRVLNESKMSKLKDFSDVFFDEYFDSLELYRERFNDLLMMMPPTMWETFERVKEIFEVIPIKFMVDNLKNKRNLTEYEIDPLVIGYKIQFWNQVLPGQTIYEFINLKYEKNFRYKPAEYLLKVHSLFDFIQNNLDINQDFYEITIEFLSKTLPEEFTPLDFASCLKNKESLNYFIKNKIFHRYFNTLNFSLLNDRPDLNRMGFDVFPCDIDIYISLLEFIFEKEKEYNSSISDFIYQIITYYEKSYAFKIDETVFEKLLLSNRSLHLDKVLTAWEYQNYMDSKIQFMHMVDDINQYKYKNIYVYILLTQIFIQSDSGLLDVHDLVESNKELVVNHLIKNPLHFPFLIKDINVRMIFMESHNDIFEGIDFTEFFPPDFQNTSALLRILSYHFRKKNIRSISFLMFTILEMSKQESLMDLLDRYLDYFCFSNSSIKRFTTFFYMVYQELNQLGSIEFELNVREFLRSKRFLLNENSFIEEYKSFYLSRSPILINQNYLSVLSKDKTALSSKVMTVLRGLVHQEDACFYIDNLLKAFAYRYYKSFASFKFPDHYRVPDFLIYQGEQASAGGISLEIGNSFDSMFLFGKIPYETCFAYDQSLTNKYLVSYIVEPSVTCWYFYSGDRVIARRIMVQAQFNSSDVMLAMPIYSSSTDRDSLEVMESLTRFLCSEYNLGLIVYDQSSGCHPVMERVFPDSSESFEVSLDFIHSGDFKFDFLDRECKVPFDESLQSYRLNTCVSGYYFPAGCS